MFQSKFVFSGKSITIQNLALPQLLNWLLDSKGSLTLDGTL